MAGRQTKISREAKRKRQRETERESALWCPFGRTLIPRGQGLSLGLQLPLITSSDRCSVSKDSHTGVRDSRRNVLGMGRRGQKRSVHDGILQVAWKSPPAHPNLAVIVTSQAWAIDKYAHGKQQGG